MSEQNLQMHVIYAKQTINAFNQQVTGCGNSSQCYLLEDKFLVQNIFLIF